MDNQMLKIGSVATPTDCPRPGTISLVALCLICAQTESGLDIRAGQKVNGSDLENR
jgi:hypothetical protein